MKILKILKKILILCIIIILLIGTAKLSISVSKGWFEREHGMVYAQSYQFEESSKRLYNPNRGFFTLYGLVVYDYIEDYTGVIKQRVDKDSPEMLYLVQINLCRFKEGPISPEGLANIENIFAALETRGKQYIIRFLYDWEGKGEASEPETIDTILTHMEQLEDVLKEYKEMIFTLQGIFVGDCGEMHHSKFLSQEDITTLICQLARVTDEQTFLAVRTPRHWRKVTQIADIEEPEFQTSTLAKRLGLFNDGIMGTEQDTGTYGVLSKTEAGLFEAWNRAEELEFQNQLCQLVPNGGEVIIENPVNDLDNAMESLATMHLTYLNRAYDANVLNKWAETIVEEDGCFQGMDGLSYIERHLGYRLLIKDTNTLYDFDKDTLSVSVTLQNVGFAPMYKAADSYMVIHDEEQNISHIYEVSGDLQVLAGGKDKEEVLTIQKEINLDGYQEGKYTLFFFIRDVDSGLRIQLANVQEEEELGYPIGELQIDSKEKWLEEALGVKR